MNKEQTLEFLSKAADLHASDIFIIAGRPLSIKTDGRLSTYGDRLMPEQTSEILEAIYQMANNRDISRLHNTGDDDFSMAIPGLSRFRVNTYRQRGSLAAVIRIISFNLLPASNFLSFQVSTRPLFLNGAKCLSNSFLYSSSLCEYDKNTLGFFTCLSTPIAS